MHHQPKLAKAEMAILKTAYEQAIYEVYYGQATIQIKIGESCPALDSLITEDNRPSWALITASNPYSQLLSELENQQRHQRLLQHLTELQLPLFPAVGKDQAGVWIPEPGFLISGIERVEAIAIGRKFEQNAIVFGELNQPAELQWLESLGTAFPFPFLRSLLNGGNPRNATSRFPPFPNLSRLICFLGINNYQMLGNISI
ncbi:MAG: DUF3293 domain-containing protein [Hydrococcus sp. SU_1_0]|nr:DUF3293 domain-containing protein [Hydrococcus sp. SU_1_0]